MPTHLLVLTAVCALFLPGRPAQDPPAAPATDVRAAYEAFVGAEHRRDANAAGEALLEFGDPALKLIRRGAEDHADAAIRRRCYDLIVKHWPTDPAALRTIEHHGLEDEHDTIRYMCAFHLGQHKVLGSFRRLQILLKDAEADELTRSAAAKSLAELGEAEGLPVLYDGLGSDWYMPRYISNVGIKALTGKDLNDFDYEYAEGAIVIGGVEGRGTRRPIEDAERRARRFRTIAAYCRWLKEARPELYKHLEGAW